MNKLTGVFTLVGYQLYIVSDRKHPKPSFRSPVFGRTGIFSTVFSSEIPGFD